MGAVVEIHSLGMKYHSLNGEVSVLKDLSLTVEEGEFVCIVGPSGCGKSTLLSLVAGLLTPSEGTVAVGGRQVNGPSSQVGYMLQKDHLFEWRTIFENVILGLEITKSLHADTAAYVSKLLETYGLAEFKNKYPNQLSGGMRQRASLIRTLATKPRILLLDEAFSALDYQTRLAVTEDIYGIIKKENKTAVLVTHDIAESIGMADRVVVLTKRPGTIKNIYDIRLSCDNRTPIRCREAPEFRWYFNRIWKDLDIHI